MEERKTLMKISVEGIWKKQGDVHLVDAEEKVFRQGWLMRVEENGMCESLSGEVSFWQLYLHFKHRKDNRLLKKLSQNYYMG